MLKLFKNNVSQETFVQTVGQGRLADIWIANVTSGKALYTDGTMGGPGKNARRKGKSTSNWAKNQRRKEEKRVQRKDAKLLRKARRSRSKFE